MSNNIEEDIKKLKARFLNINWNYGRLALTETQYLDVKQLIENILADRERLQEDYKIQEDNYKMLIEDVSNIAKELNLQEDATIDEIYTAIRILKSKRINLFETLECIDKANKYDSLVEKIKKKKRYFEECDELIVTSDRNYSDGTVIKRFIDTFQELLDTEQIKKEV